MDTWIVALLFYAVTATVAGNKAGTQRFQADSFLDMLGRSFDPSTAYVDLLGALSKRLKIDLTGSSNSSKSSEKSKTAAENSVCQHAPGTKGVVITYTSDVRTVGSRAFYQCDTGYNGMSKFIQCLPGGQWSPLTDWEGCTIVDCGSIIPHVQHAEPLYTTTTYGSLVFFSCNSGYKLDTPNANISCLDTGFWDKPSFACQKANSPPLHLPSLQKAFNKNIGVQKIQQLQQLATTLLGAGPSSTTSSNSKSSQQQTAVAPLTMENPMMAAFMKNMQAFQALPSVAKNEQANIATPVTNSNSAAGNPFAAMFAQMFSKLSPTPAPTTTTTTTKPVIKLPGGLQLPTHLQSLLPKGLPNSAGIKAQDLMTLATMGLGSSNSATAPRDITQLLGTMNPMSMFGGGMGLGLGALASRGRSSGTGAAGAAPMEPEKVVEQREEMMMRAMMAAMMGGGGGGASRNGTANRNPAMDMMTIMALQSQLGAANGGASGGSAGMDPLSMMFGGMGGGSGSSGGLFGNLFGGAKKK